MDKIRDDCTEDSLFDGRLCCLQPKAGYRFSLDAILLAHFIEPNPGDRILDLGAGCGIVSLIVSYRRPTVHCTALELQPEMVALGRRSLELNSQADPHIKDRIEIVEGDLRRIGHHVAPESFNWVVTNPPYRKTESSRLCRNKGLAMARHEISVDLAAVVTAAAFAVCNTGRVALCYPADRGAALINALKAANLEPKRLQIVHDYPGSPGWLVLVEAVKNGGEGLVILPPFFVRQEVGGAYSTAMNQCYLP